MKQIQKCPHCHKDAIFSQSICPNCGLESRYEEREEPDYKQDIGGRVPVYAEAMESEMTVGQKHGAIFLGLLLGLLTLPGVAMFLMRFFLLFDEAGTAPKPVFIWLLFCVVYGWLDWELWHGKMWVKYLFAVIGLIGGIAMEVNGIQLIMQMQNKTGRVDTINLLLCLIFGIVYLWAGYQLWRNKNILEFIKYQQRMQED